MSMRAKFVFEHSLTDKPVAFCVPHYGGPDSVAIYLWNMHRKRNDDRDELADLFIKANPDEVKLTSYNGSLDDDEIVYYYHMDKNGCFQAKEIVWLFDPKDTNYQTFFKDHYAEFINRYNEDEIDIDEKLETFYRLSKSAKKLSLSPYLTLPEVENEVQSYMLRNTTSENEAENKRRLSIWLNEYRRIKALRKSD